MSAPSPEEPEILQLTPGPTGIHPDVLREVAKQTLNHTHPDFLEECQKIQRLVRLLFGTTNEATGVFTASGTGGDEAGVMNFVQPGDNALVVNSGFFSGRFTDMIRRRYPKEITEIDTGYGNIIDPQRFEDALKKFGTGGVAAAFLAQIETSAGTQVPHDVLCELGIIAKRYETLLCIDSVCAFGGVAVNADAWQAAYVSACSQKGVNAPPGTAPFTAAPFAMKRIEERIQQGFLPGSLYWDLPENMRYWGDGKYHATPGIQGLYGLRRAMEMTLERAGGNLPQLFAEHERNQRALEEGLEALGFENGVDPRWRAAVVSVLRTPKNMNAHHLRKRLLDVREVRGQRIAGVEVAAGKKDPEREIRIALLGFWSNIETVLAACDAFEQVTGQRGAATQAAERYFAEHVIPT